jgi:fatty acid synthase
MSENEADLIYLVADSTENVGIVGLVNCLRLESGGERIRCIVCPPFFNIKESNDPSDLVMNIMDKNGVLGSYRHVDSDISSSVSVASEYAYLNVLTKGDLSSLKWIQAPFSFPEHRSEHLCQVLYASLNFRDIMIAVGKLAEDALPGALNRDCVLGLEFVGQTYQGHFVMGAVEGRGLATHVAADSSFMWPVPLDWSLEEAATVPIAYSTVSHSFLEFED